MFVLNISLRLEQTANLCHLSHPVVDPDGDLGGGLPVVHLGEAQRGMVLGLRL